MRFPVILGAFLASLALAVLNNLVNPDSVSWFGSPEVLPKPEGWPSLGFAAGAAAGFKVAWKGFLADRNVILGMLAAIVIFSLFLKKAQGFSPGPFLRSVLRIGLAAMFLAAAWPKFSHPDDFALLVAQYQFLPAFLVYPFSLWLSAFEIVVALLLILTPWEREGAALTGLLMAMFIVALAQALGRGLGIACGCFDIAGAADAGETWFSLLRDMVLLPPVVWLAAGRRRWLWQLGPSRW